MTKETGIFQEDNTSTRVMIALYSLINSGPIDSATYEEITSTIDGRKVAITRSISLGGGSVRVSVDGVSVWGFYPLQTEDLIWKQATHWFNAINLAYERRESKREKEVKDWFEERIVKTFK